MEDTNTFTLVFYRSVIQILISLWVILREGGNPFGPPDARFWLVVRGLFGAAAVCAWFFGIQVLPLPDAVTLQFTTPPFAAIFAVCLVGETWKPLDQIGAVVCLTGVALIAHPTWLFGSEGVAADDDAETPAAFMKALAVLVTEGGAALAGIAYVSVRKIGDRASAIVMVLYYGSISIPMTIIGFYLSEGSWNVLGNMETFSIKDYILLLLMGFAGYGGQWFTNLGLQKETAATVSAVYFVERVSTSAMLCYLLLFSSIYIYIRTLLRLHLQHPPKSFGHMSLK